MTPGRALFGDRQAPDGSRVRENFDAWFGSSVMLNERGLPRVLYHGSRADFHAFKVGQHGIFFAERAEQADSFANLSGRQGPGRILPVYLRIVKPWTLISYPDTYPYSKMVDQSTEALVAQGYDGMYRPGDGAWIVFSPNQIKSAIGNSGMFSRESDDIADQVARPVDTEAEAGPLRQTRAALRMECADLREEDSALPERMRS